MNTLPKHGIIPRTDNGVPTKQTLTSLLHDVRNKIEPGEFFERSNELLKTLEKVVLEEIVPELETYYGRWHPSGFMVYQLGEHKELGTLRLHIWPKDLRKRQVKGSGQLGDIYDGDIHNHAWNLTSRVLAYYCDNIYDVKPAEGKDLTTKYIVDNDLFRVFNVTYEENVQQSLTPNGKYVTATVAQRREAKRGEVHTIEPGVFHSPTIPEDKLGSTLVFDSFRVTDGPDILVRGTDQPIFDTREAVSQDEAILAKNQLLQAVAQDDN